LLLLQGFLRRCNGGCFWGATSYHLLLTAFIASPSTSHYILPARFEEGTSGTCQPTGRPSFPTVSDLMNIAVFASGRGSNFQAILYAIDRGVLPARVTLVVCNKAEAGALAIARSHSIPAIHIGPQQFPSEDAYVAKLLGLLAEYRVELIALAGYLKRIPSAVVQKFRNKILNVHPALLPSFGGPGMYGMHVHEAVIRSGVKISGASVHVVDEEYDRGPIVLQKTVEVKEEDTPESLALKVLQVEHEIYPLALKAFAEGRIKIQGTKIWIRQS